MKVEVNDIDRYRSVEISKGEDGQYKVVLRRMVGVDKGKRFSVMPSVADPSKRTKYFKLPTDELEWNPKWKKRKRMLRCEQRLLMKAAKQIIQARILEDLKERIEMDKSLIVKDDKGLVQWTEPLKQSLLEHLAEGGTVLQFAKAVGVARTQVERLMRTEEMRPLVERAKREGADALAEEALEIASTPLIIEESIESYSPARVKDQYTDVGLDGSGFELRDRVVKKADNVHARKLAYQARMHLVSKIAPERYGEKPEVRETDTMAERLIKARQRIRNGG